MSDLMRLREPDLFWREIDEEIVVLDGRTWEYLSLNSSARVLWKRLVDGASAADLVELLTRVYDIDQQTARSDVRAFLGMLEEKNLLQR
jgi:hypothetical protein